MKPTRKYILFSSIVGIYVSFIALAQKEYSYKNQLSTGAEANRFFGVPQTHNQNDPTLDAGQFQFELGSKLECGKIDISANVKGQFRELQDQLRNLIPKNSTEALDFLQSAAFTTICYAYPTICAQLRHDWLSIQGKLNLRSQACAAVDKFIDSQASKGAKQLKSEAIAKCVASKTSGGGDVAAALQVCQNETGLAMRDFQTGVMRNIGEGKQSVLKSILSFAKDETSYEFLSTFLGEIQVGTDGGWVPLFEKGISKPSAVADTFLTKGQGLVCNKLESILSGRFSGQNLYENEVSAIVKKKLNLQIVSDLEILPTADKQIACLALGRAVGKEAGLKAASKQESAVSSGLLNTAIPETLRNEFRERSIAAFPAMRQALSDENIPTVERVLAELQEFANLQRSKTAILASETNRGKLKNSISDAQTISQCTDSLSCGGN